MNLRFNKEKSRIGILEVKYLGHILSQEGIRPNPSKVQAIAEMETPKARPLLERFLGMVTYFSKFIPLLSALTGPLRELLQKDIAWHWTERHDEATNKIIEKAKTSLRYYDIKKLVRLWWMPPNQDWEQF